MTTVVGSGNIVEETRSVTGATGVDLRGVASLTIERGPPEELILETDDNLMAHILTDVRGGILEIRKDPTVNLQPSRLQGTGIEADLTLSSIESITLSGIGGITVSDLTTTRLEEAVADKPGSAPISPSTESKIEFVNATRGGDRVVSAKDDLRGLPGGIKGLEVKVIPEGETVVLTIRRIAGCSGSAIFDATGSET